MCAGTAIQPEMLDIARAGGHVALGSRASSPRRGQDALDPGS